VCERERERRGREREIENALLFSFVFFFGNARVCVCNLLLPLLSVVRKRRVCVCSKLSGEKKKRKMEIFGLLFSLSLPLLSSLLLLSLLYVLCRKTTMTERLIGDDIPQRKSKSVGR
jgi:hypothetical protein